MTEQETANPFRMYLRVAVSGLLTELGFTSAENVALETLTELTQSFISELGRSTRSFCELANRVEPVSADVVLALVEMGVLARSASNYHFLPFRRPPPRLDWPPAGERGSPSADRSSLLVGLLPSPATGCITHLVINISSIFIVIIKSTISITFCAVAVILCPATEFIT